MHPSTTAAAIDSSLVRFFRRVSRGSSVQIPAVRRAMLLCDALLSGRGDVSGARLAADALAAFGALDDAGRDAFLDWMATNFLPRPDEVAEAAEAYRRRQSPDTLARLRSAADSPLKELFRRLNLAPGGTKALVDLRRSVRATLARCPDRASIDAELAELFRSWFNGGFLTLSRIDWRTSAMVLERLIAFEAVHQIQGWIDLRRRLEQDRRCYAFFHPALPDEPLIFVEIALVRRMSAYVQPLLDPDSAVLDPAAATCGTFYSITNCHEGLQGISFGNLLIKQVVEDLQRTFPRLRTFATLSPLPGFRAWLMAELETDGGTAVSRGLARTLTDPDNQSRLDALLRAHRYELKRLCAHYLLEAKQGRAPLDPVARFHLANGARLERVNWAADTSEPGIRRSLGLMVNYVYRTSELEANHEAYARDRKVTSSRRVQWLARGRSDRYPS